MLNLIPSHTEDYDYLYRLVTDRNKWFIKLRYGAVAMLLLFFGYHQLFSEQPGIFQNILILAISLTILTYNIILSRLTSRDEKAEESRINFPMGIAFAQILLDLVMLMLLVYATGLVESPFAFFFVFHAIIGSMILPGRIVTFIFTILLVIYSFAITMVEFGLLPYFDILTGGQFEKMPIPRMLVYLASYWLMIMMSVKFANSLAEAHFIREQELNLALKTISKAEQEKQKYVMAVVHEIKSPIAAITSYLNILLGGIAGELSDKVKDILKKSKTRADDAIVLTNEILDVSRVKLLEVLKKEPLYLEKIIAGAVDSVHSKMEDKEIEFITEDLSDRCVQVKADRRLMELVMSNLLSNAVKYNRQGGRVILRLEHKDGLMHISVTDTGIGIPKEEQDELFNEFFRASNAKKINVEGTGLGLATVKRAIEKNGGKIEIVSPGHLATKENPGTTAIVTFPVEV